ncbi:MAG: polyribonucleotide nucleotidyltransferase [Acidimicrobiia bacterium]|nr:polyribonucleotide nucleotidyltransferase [Acidimicrobiia bacterium]NNL71184.1 polyribonucleotide nucleotidyltransferase [Acidimicrobiia bacterium]
MKERRVSEFTVSKKVGNSEVTISAGNLAQQADGAVTVMFGETEVLVTAVSSRRLREGVDFFPLTVDCEERMYAVGRIPGSFFRREGRATERAILTCRLIDRPLRPSFREGFRSETHIIATVLQVDHEHPYDIAALNGASAALTISPIPFEGPLAGVRMGLKNGEWMAMPTHSDMEDAVFELTVAGKRNESGGIDIVMVEAGATEEALRLIEGGQPPSDEDTVARGLEEAKPFIAQLIDLQLELAANFDPPEVEWPVVTDYTPEAFDRVSAAIGDRANDVITIADKKARGEAQSALAEAIESELITEETDPDEARMIKKAFGSVMKQRMRQRVVSDGVRLDGRAPTDLRALEAEVGVLDRTHGSGLFKRGETQVLNVTTLGMLRMEQMLDTIALEESKRYMHHYNFPPYSTGETGFMRGPKRREIGHGALAEKALLPAIPSADDFPYAFRLVSEVLASNGSSSMASVCGSSLSLMDAGVPIAAPVAGIAMGLIAHDGGFITLTDILGAEDALGDMDFKVAGTANVITALQLDTKIEGLPAEVLTNALNQAKDARLTVLDAMAEAIDAPRSELRPYTPRIEAVQIPRDKIGEVIGPKGKMIREIEEETGATLDIDDDGTVRVGAADQESMEAAREKVLMIAFPPEPELGKEYEGEVVNITKFGAFVNILPGRDGLLHISKIGGDKRIDNVEDVLSLGDKIQVVVGEIDRNGKVSLNPAGMPPSGGDGGGREARSDRDRGDRDRGDRDRGDRGRGDRDRKPRERSGRDRDREGSRDRDGNRDRDRDRDGNRDRDRSRDRDGNRNSDSDGGRRKRRPRRDDGGDQGSDSSGRRRAVSFEDEFERGLD